MTSHIYGRDHSHLRIVGEESCREAYEKPQDAIEEQSAVATPANPSSSLRMVLAGLAATATAILLAAACLALALLISRIALFAFEGPTTF
jgi:hypothetical protein